MTLSSGWPQEAAAEHRCESQRNETGDQNRNAYRDGEFMQETPDDPAHEKDRNKHGGERNRHRQDREGDFA